MAALLAGVRAHLQQPKQLLLGRLAGLVASGGSGSSRELRLPASWQFFVRLLCCLRALQGAAWEALVKVGSGIRVGERTCWLRRQLHLQHLACVIMSA